MAERSVGRGVWRVDGDGDGAARGLLGRAPRVRVRVEREERRRRRCGGRCARGARAQGAHLDVGKVRDRFVIVVIVVFVFVIVGQG
jgi:hypothetical protein